MMYDVLITDVNLENFAPLIPNGLLAQVRSGELLAIGGVEDFWDMPVAVLLCRVVHGWLEIVWIAAADGWRDHGGGFELLRVFSDRIRGRVRGLFADMPPEDPEGEMADIFRRWGFHMTQAEQELYTLPLGELTSIKLLRGKNFGKVKSLGKTASLERKAVLGTIAQDSRPVPLPKPLDWERYDQDLSALAEDKGLLLVEQQGEELFFSCLWSKEPLVLQQMLAYTLEQAEKKFSLETPVTMQVVGDRAAALLAKLLPERHPALITQARYDFKTERGSI